MRARRRVTLQVDLAGSYGRGLYEGIARYGTLVGQWELWVRPSIIWSNRPQPSDWEVDGAILFGLWVPPAVEAARLGLPMVNLTDTVIDRPLPQMQVDHHAIGHLAAKHLLERGLRNFGFVGWARSQHADDRCAGFVRTLEGQGSFTRYDYPVDNVEQAPIWPDPGLVTWLRAAEKPIGVFCSNDEVASCVLDAARSTGMAVPEVVSVLGVDNDELVLQRSIIPLSSIELPATRLGYEAAVLLDQLMDGERPTPRPASDFPPVQVITRQSTEASAVEDADVAMAMRFIRDRAMGPVSMQDVAATVAMSTRSMELRFRRAIGQSPGEFLIRTRLSQAQRLLLETDLKLAVIAKRTAFCSVSHFGSLFRQYLGVTPTAYRKNRRIT